MTSEENRYNYKIPVKKKLTKFTVDPNFFTKARYIGIYPYKFISFHREIYFNYKWRDIYESSPPFDFNEIGPKQYKFINSIHPFKKLFPEGYEKNLKAAKSKDLQIYKDWEKLKARSEKIYGLDKEEISSTFYELKEIVDNIPIGDNFQFFVNDFDDAVIIFKELAYLLLPDSYYKRRTEEIIPYTNEEYNEFTKKYLFSVITRLGFEAFNLLPINQLQIIVKSSSNAPIISINFNRDLLDYTKVKSADRIIDKFSSEYKFSKETGFHRIDTKTDYKSTEYLINDENTNTMKSVSREELDLIQGNQDRKTDDTEYTTENINYEITAEDMNYYRNYDNLKNDKKDMDKLLPQYPENTDNFSLNTLEIDFFTKLLIFLAENNIDTDLVKSNRLKADGTINLRYDEKQFGRIKLQGNNKKIQILEKDIVNWENIEGTNYREYLEKWLKYINTIKEI